MKPIYTILLSITIGLTFSSCEVISYLAQSYTNYVEETGNDPLKIKDHATAWQQGSTSQGLVMIDAGIAAMGAVTGKDVSSIRNITKSTIDSLALHPHAGESEKINLISGLLYTADRVIDHFEDKAFEERVAALSEECARYSDPDHPRYDPSRYNPYCMEWYDIDYDNRRITKRDSKDAINSIRQIERENYLNQTYPELVKYGLVYDEEIMRERNGKYVGTGRYQLQAAFVRLMKQSRDDVLKKGGDIAKYDEYQQLMYKLRSIKTQEYYSPSNSTYKSSDNDTEYSTPEVADNITIEEQPSLPLETIETEELTNKTSASYICESKPIVINKYAFNSIELSISQKKELDTIIQEMLANDQLGVKIIGHTCDIGSAKANQSVGMKRANQAKAYLVSKGVATDRIQVSSAGSTQPLEPNIDATSRSKNRRISIEIINL